MGLRLSYNGYNFDTETTLVPIARAFEHDDRGRVRYEMQTWRVRTILQADGQTAITAAINALLDKLEDGHNLILYQSTGSIKTPHELLDASTLAGVQITNISYPESTGSEYANKRVVEIVFSGVKSVSQTDNVLTFHETVSFSGGGPRDFWQEGIEGDPQKYRVAEKTLYYATQRGSMEALALVEAPGPLWGTDVQDGNPDIEYAPFYDANNQLRYRISWAYRFISKDAFALAYNAWR